LYLKYLTFQIFNIFNNFNCYALPYFFRYSDEEEIRQRIKRRRQQPDERAFREFQKCYQCQHDRPVSHAVSIYTRPCAKLGDRHERKIQTSTSLRSIKFPLRKKFQICQRIRLRDATCTCARYIPHRSELLGGIREHKSLSLVGANYVRRKEAITCSEARTSATDTLN